MSETRNDYIHRVKTFSTFLRRSRYPHHVANARDNTDGPK